MQRTMVATTEGNASSPVYQPRKQGWLFWLARAQVSDFAQTASVQAGIVSSGGLWDRCLLVFWRLPAPASHYFHPDFGYLCPTQRFRRGLRLALTCLAMALAGAGVMGIFSAPKLIPAVPPDQASTAETNPTTTPTPYAAVDLRPAMAKGAQIVVAGRPSCVADTRPEGNCVSVKLREPRMVWVGNDRSAIVAIALARRAPSTTGINDAVLPAAGAGHPGAMAKASEADIAAASSTEAQKKTVAAPRKAQRSANRQNHRRDQYWNGAPSGREVRVDDWPARGYAPRERDYQRGAYGRGITLNFW
jgi:hypothetical protein